MKLKIYALMLMLSISVYGAKTSKIVISPKNNSNMSMLEKENNIKVNYEIGDLGIKEPNEELQELNKIYENTSKEKTMNTNNKYKLLHQIVKDGMKYIGIKYLWGGTTFKGMDCSGFTQNVFKDFGIKIPRVSRHQYKFSQKIKPEDARLGDLVFFKTTDKDVVSHVALYIGSNKFIHASSKGGRIMVSELTGYYKKHFYAFGRYVK